MAYADFDVDISDVRAGLRRAARAVSDASPLMDAIGHLMLDSTERKFSSQSDGERRWDPAKESLDHPLLDDTGRLKGSIEMSYDDREVNVGTDVEYGPLLQDGSSVTPARAFLNISSADEREIESAVLRYMEREIR